MVGQCNVRIRQVRQLASLVVTVLLGILSLYTTPAAPLHKPTCCQMFAVSITWAPSVIKICTRVTHLRDCNISRTSRYHDVQRTAIVNVSVYYSVSRMWLLLIMGTERQGIAVYGPKSTKGAPFNLW